MNEPDLATILLPCSSLLTVRKACMENGHTFHSVISNKPRQLWKLYEPATEPHLPDESDVLGGKRGMGVNVEMLN